MQTKTILLVVLAIFFTAVIVWFQYYKQSKTSGKLNVILSILRFISIFSLLTLLINPKFNKGEFTIEKPNLIIAIDNTSSVNSLGGSQGILNSIDKIKSNSSLSDRFETSSYLFGNTLIQGDSITLDDKRTNLSVALNSLNQIYGKSKSAVVLLSDGNQTLGLDYEYLKLDADLHVFPIVVGDTTSYEDLRIGRVNTNKYAFLKNKFPVEINLAYTGDRSINSIIRIYLNGKQVFRQSVSFNSKNATTTINTLLRASSVGVKNMKIVVDKLSNEKNSINNSKELSLEVIDEKTNVGLITSIMHPDIGALKKSIETNEQREVQILKPNVPLETLENIDVFILYQPNKSFKPIYEFVQKRGGGIFTITGNKTDWSFLNTIQSSFLKESYNQKEEILPTKNQSFSFFDISDLSFEDYPPLESNLGDIVISQPFETIANQRIKGVDLDTPLFLVVNQEQKKEAVLFGENIWKWRVQTFRNEQSFKTFDDFLGKLLFYLSDVKQKSRLTIDYESLYDGSTNAAITASYFDNSYEFDPNASLVLRLNKLDSNFSREIPMLLKGTNYDASLDDLDAGSYEFTVIEPEEKLSRSGQFQIIDFNLEEQFLAADYKKLNRFSKSSGGQLYFPEQIELLIENLANDNRFIPVQKSKRNVVSLIDFRYLLILMVLALAIEWFIRKYNGLL
jgi:hypothetical protein